MVALALEKLDVRMVAETGAERRMFPRKNIQARVQTWRMDHTIQARQNPRVFLELRDISLGGVSAQSEVPLDSGEHVTVCFPSSKRQPAWDAFGRVIRCQPTSVGFRVAVEFDPLPAA